jgi:hypothetical protein
METPQPNANRPAWRLPLGIFLVALMVFAIGAGPRLKGPSTDPHFAYLANTYNSMVAAALGSQEAQARRQNKVAFELDQNPPHRNDWASYWEITLKTGEVYKGNWMERQGSGRFRLLNKQEVVLDARSLAGANRQQRYFMSFPPGPAVLMMPLAAVSGYQVNDVALTIVFAALNVMLMFLLLQRFAARGLGGRTTTDNLWLTAMFGFGTAHFWCATLGQVWFTALIMGVTFTLAYVYFALDEKRPFLAGLALALAFSTRTPLLYTALFFYVLVLFPDGAWRKHDWSNALKRMAWFSLPCLVIGTSLLIQNHIRFESLSEFGHSYLAGGGLQRVKQFGLFHPVFLSKNLTAAFTLLPRVITEYPYVLISKHGMSLFVTTPAFIYLFRPLPRESPQEVFWHRLLWLIVLLTAIPHFFYQNTGYEQFGYRFSLDYLVYLMLLLALGRRPINWVFKVSILVGVAVNAFGVAVFKRVPRMFKEEFFV